MVVGFYLTDKWSENFLNCIAYKGFIKARTDADFVNFLDLSGKLSKRRENNKYIYLNQNKIK